MKPMLGELGWDRTTFASAMTLRMLLMVLTLSWAGQLTDRFGTRVVLAGGALIVGAGVFGVAGAHSLPQFYAVMASMGPGQACIGPVAASALVVRLVERRRGIAVGILNGGDNLISAAIPLVAAALLAQSGWRGTLSTLAGAYFVLALLILLALRPGEGSGEESGGRTATRRPSARLRDLPLGDWRLWTLCLLYAAIYAFVTSVQLHMHAYQTDLGRTPEQASRIMSLLILAGAFGAPLFGWLAEAIGARRALLLLVSGLAVTSVVIWSVESYPTFLAWALVYGLVNSGVVALLALVLTELYGSEQIGRLMGVAMVFCMGATMVANLYSASMFDQHGSYRIAWQTYSVLMTAALAPAALLARAR